MTGAHKYLLKRSQKCSYDNSTQCCIMLPSNYTMFDLPITITLYPITIVSMLCVCMYMGLST